MNTINFFNIDVTAEILNDYTRVLEVIGVKYESKQKKKSSETLAVVNLSLLRGLQTPTMNRRLTACQLCETVSNKCTSKNY